MLGNWVEYATGIKKDKLSIPMQVTGIFADTVYLDFEGNEGDVFEEEGKNLLGIPITEELVLQIGFDKDNLPTYFAERYIKDGVRLQICNGEGRLVTLTDSCAAFVTSTNSKTHTLCLRGNN